MDILGDLLTDAFIFGKLVAILEGKLSVSSEIKNYNRVVASRGRQSYKSVVPVM